MTKHDDLIAVSQKARSGGPATPADEWDGIAARLDEARKQTTDPTAADVLLREQVAVHRHRRVVDHDRTVPPIADGQVPVPAGAKAYIAHPESPGSGWWERDAEAVLAHVTDGWIVVPVNDDGTLDWWSHLPPNTALDGSATVRDLIALTARLDRLERGRDVGHPR